MRYRRAMADSEFSPEYYRELVYTHVDNINLLYVALTRAADSLHVFIPRRNDRTVGALLLQSIRVEGDRALLDGIEGRYTADETGERFAFGEFTGPEPARKKAAAKPRHVILEDYPTDKADLRLRLPSQRYFEEGDTELSPRNFGILMHRAFELADDEEQIHRAVAQMQDDGILAKSDAAALRVQIDRALAHPEVREWFGGKWRRVRNEYEIIRPGKTSTRRPDRVMIGDDGRVVVVDYKFGKLDPESHRRQIREYMRLLREMGYAKTEGFLWYVRLGKIEKVDD